LKRSSYWTCQAAFAVFAVMAGCVLGGRTALKHGIECFAGPPYLVLGQVQSLGAGSGPSVTLASVGTWEGPPVRSAAGASPEKLPGSPQTEKGSGEGEEPKGGGVFKLINFVILAGALVYLLRKPLGSFLAQRSDTIREELEEGRKALEASQTQLRVIEDKLGRLEEEIASFKAAATREMEAEGERLRSAAAEEAEKVAQSARAQIEISARAAKLELKVYAAAQAVELAEEMVRQRLDENGRKRLVTRFVEDLKNGRPSGN